MSSGGKKSENHNHQNPERPGAIPESGDEQASHETRHRYASHRDDAEGQVQGRDYGRVRGPDAQNPDEVIQGGENHSYGGYGSDYVRAREEFGGGDPVPPETGREYAPGQEPGRGSGVGAFGQGGTIIPPGEDEDGQALAPDEHPGILQPDGEIRRPD